MLQATETRLVGIYFLFKQRGKPAPACGRAGLTSAHRGRNEVLTSGKSNEGAKPADECPQMEERSSDLCLSNEENRLPLVGHPNILRADASDEETSPAMIR